MRKANEFIRAVIELEFDKGDEISEQVIAEYIQDLYQNAQLHVRYFDAEHNEYPLSSLTKRA